MSVNENPKSYDLEERTFQCAKVVSLFVKELPKTISNIEYAKQMIRSSASPGANYIEANENLGNKDFLMKLKTCRRESPVFHIFLKNSKNSSETLY